MIMLLIVLVLIVLAAMVLAVELLRPLPVAEEGLVELSQSLADGRNYEPMTRLFDLRDVHTVNPLDRGAKRLARQRAVVMRLYLKQLRGDFLMAWAICRLLAPVSQESDTVIKLFRSWIKFHSLLGLVWMRTYVGHSASSVDQVRTLVAAFGDLREGATQLLGLESDLAAASSGA